MSLELDTTKTPGVIFHVSDQSCDPVQSQNLNSEDARANEKATEVFSGVASAAAADKSTLDQTSVQIQSSESANISSAIVTPSGTVTNEVPPELSKKASFLKTCGSCMRVAKDRIIGMGQFAVLGAAAFVGLGLKITSIEKSTEVLKYSISIAKDLLRDLGNNNNGLYEDLVSVGVIRNLWYAGRYSIGTIVVNCIGLVAGIAGTVVYGASVIYDAAGGYHFCEMVEGARKWYVLIPIGAQTVFDASGISTSWNASSYLGQVIIADKLIGLPLPQNITNDMHEAFNLSASALAYNAASLAMVLGVPLLIYCYSKGDVSNRISTACGSFFKCFCR